MTQLRDKIESMPQYDILEEISQVRNIHNGRNFLRMNHRIYS